MRAYVSSYIRGSSTAGTPGLRVLALDDCTGGLSLLQHVGRPNPTWLEIDPSGHALWACYGPDTENPSCSVVRYEIVSDTGELSNPVTADIGPGSPAQIAISPDGTHLSVANYGAGETTVHRIRANGHLGAPTDAITNVGSGPHPRQDASHPHAVVFTPDGRFLVTADLGCDLVQSYRIDRDGASHEVGRARSAAGSGPRHVAFTADVRTLYVIGELDGDISVFAFDPATGVIGDLIQTIATAPGAPDRPQSASEIALHPSGMFLYASNRRSQTIAAYRIDPSDGRLSLIQYICDRISGPTNFAIDPSGTRLFVNCSEADEIVAFRIDETTGRLQRTERPMPLPAPNVMAWV